MDKGNFQNFCFTNLKQKIIKLPKKPYNKEDFAVNCYLFFK